MILLVSLCRCVVAMIEKTECCYVMSAIKGKAMFSLHSTTFYLLMCIHKNKEAWWPHG